MSELKIEQIHFFHSLKLQPISKKEIQKWVEIIDCHLISVNNIKECFVEIDNFVLSTEKIYKLRGKKKKKRCCNLC